MMSKHSKRSNRGLAFKYVLSEIKIDSDRKIKYILYWTWYNFCFVLYSKNKKV